jgi:hypothetical protein
VNLIVEDGCQRVLKNGDPFLEGHPVLAGILSGLTLVPLESGVHLVPAIVAFTCPRPAYAILSNLSISVKGEIAMRNAKPLAALLTLFALPAVAAEPTATRLAAPALPNSPPIPIS